MLELRGYSLPDLQKLYERLKKEIAQREDLVRFNLLKRLERIANESDFSLHYLTPDIEAGVHRMSRKEAEKVFATWRASRRNSKTAAPESRKSRTKHSS